MNIAIAVDDEVQHEARPRASEAGLDPELELRTAARRFADSVRAQERLAGATDE